MTLLFGLVGCLFLRRRPQAPSWNERKANIYEQIRRLLYRVIEAQERLSADEEAAETPGMKRLPYAERVRWANQSVTAQQKIEGIHKEHRYMLAQRVREIVDNFFRRLSDEGFWTPPARI